MDRIYLPRRHGCRASFLRLFSDVIFVFDEKDKALLTARFEKSGSSWDQEYKTRRKYCLARCRRYIATIKEITPLLVQLFETYGPMKDAKTGAPLFNKEAWKQAKLVLEIVRDGFLSDPPGVELYYVVRQCGGSDGKLQDGVQVYRCCRGTNMTDAGGGGGVHKNIRRRFRESFFTFSPVSW